YGDAVCLDVSYFAPKSWISAAELKEAVKKSGAQIKRGDIVLLYTAHWNRHRGTPSYSTDNPGLTKEACEWLADQGVKSFGVDSVTPDNPIDQAQNRIFPCHEVLRDRQFIHMENLANLDKVVGKRFTFIGFPVKLSGASAAPIRAVAILNFGVSWYHRNFSGSVWLSPGLFVDVVVEICKSLTKHGYVRKVIVNCHGGNAATLTVAINRFYEETGERVLLAQWWEVASD